MPVSAARVAFTVNLEQATACGSLNKLTTASEMTDKNKQTQKPELPSAAGDSALVCLSTTFEAHPSHPFKLVLEGVRSLRTMQVI